MKLPSGATINWELKCTWALQGRAWPEYGENTIKVSSGVNDPAANTPQHVGSVVFALDLSHDHARKLKCGFRQAARCQFSTLFYAGAKEEDGSIIASTAGELNGTWQIDASPRATNGLAPNSPYFQWPQEIIPTAKTGGYVTITVADEPAAILAASRTNPKTRKYNYLIAQKRREQFLTVAYVEDISQNAVVTLVPLEAVAWRYDVDLQVPWTDEVPLAPTGNNRLTSVDRYWSNFQSIDGFSRIHVSRADPADNMVKKRGDYSNMAYAAQMSNANYAYEVYETYAEDLKAEPYLPMRLIRQTRVYDL